MRFCADCESYLKKTKDGLWCPKCKKLTKTELHCKVKFVRKPLSNTIYVVDGSNEDRVKVSQACPKCGSGEAFHWFQPVTGEHAGIRRERAVEHFKCVECSYSWSKSS